ncbi:pentapeptide repeat-containing protein [Paenibacillus sp. NPDC058174]|uniref:pentapeptide repeat-containing protein n=1 Tax=Paenibacillus sp. NPDC058174 TaxID=3346366 RepID=UPI0036DDBAE5
MESLIISKPIAVLNSSMKVNFSDFFRFLGKAVVGGVFLDSKEVVSNSYEALLALGLEKDINQITWLLIYRSLSKAISNLVEESNETLNETEVDLEAVILRIDFSLENKTFKVERNFFENPKALTILNDIAIPFGQWLDGFGLNESQIKSIVERLPSYFVLALHEEWRSKSDEYKSIANFFESPFMKANERELSWFRYSAYLRKETEKRMFDETFSLKRIFVPLRAYYNQRIIEVADGEDVDFSAPQRNSRVVVDLERELDFWLKTNDKDDAIRIISGGPGSGKSSFAKIYAAKLTESQAVPVLFIPLHHFELTDDLIDAVGRFVQFDKFFGHNPLDPQNGEEKLIIFFDGLDELSKQGKLANEIAGQFIEEVQRKVDRFNMNELRLQVIMTGRELSVQQNKEQFRRPKQILEILPYFIKKGELHKYSYSDPDNLLVSDQRDIWWKLYGLASGNNYNSMPDTLRGKNLEEITSQPLLNYLVALSFVRDKIDFRKENNLNEIYKDLLQAVYERGWANSKHPSIKDTTLEQFIRILEVIAVSAWHGAGRTTTIKDIENYINNNGLKELLNRFQENAAKGVTRLLTAFYFRESGLNNSGDNTFEFTHKSFGEYLTSRRIIQSLIQISRMMLRRKEDPDDGWDDKTSIVHLISICGFAKVDKYLINFINGELRYLTKEKLLEIQKSLVKLLNYCIKHDVPVDRIDPRPLFSYERIYSNNTYETLVVLLSLTSNLVKSPVKIDWGAKNTFGNILKMITGQRSNAINGNVMSHLRFLDISNQCLDIADLFRADFSFTRFEAGEMHYANAVNSNFEEAILTRTVLNYSLLKKANFTNSTMLGAELIDVKAQQSVFNNVNLNNASLYKSDFSGAIFNNTSAVNINKSIKRRRSSEAVLFNDAELSDTDFTNSMLRNCNFQYAKLTNINFSESDLSMSDFNNASLINVNFRNANLTLVDFEKVSIISNCVFLGSYCDFKRDGVNDIQYSEAEE